MRKWFLILSILLLSLFPLPARAQGSLGFSSVTVDLWPEFDQPNVLVIYHYNLPADVSLPVKLQLLVPISANINAVAVSDTNGALVTASYDKTSTGDWSALSLEANSRSIQVEYYDNYQLQGDQRTYTFTWPGNYPVDNFTVSFQQPVDATGLKLTPDLSAGTIGADGLVYYTGNAGALPVNQTYSLKFEYTKTSTRLSGQNVQPSAPLDSNVQGRVSFSAYLPWILGGLGGLLALGGIVAGVIYWRNEQKQNRRPSRRRRPSASEPVAGGDVYCNQCGKRAQPGDVFCRSCGTRLRHSS